MFLIIAKLWEMPKCLSIGEYRNTPNTIKYYLAIKKE